MEEIPENEFTTEYPEGSIPEAVSVETELNAEQEEITDATEIKGAVLNDLQKEMAIESGIIESLNINTDSVSPEELSDVFLQRLDDIAKTPGAVDMVANRLTSDQAADNIKLLLDKGANPIILLGKLDSLDVGLHVPELLSAGANGQEVTANMEPDDILGNYDLLIEAGATKEQMRTRIVNLVGSESYFTSELDKKAA